MLIFPFGTDGAGGGDPPSVLRHALGTDPPFLPALVPGHDDDKAATAFEIADCQLALLFRREDDIREQGLPGGWHYQRQVDESML